MNKRKEKELVKIRHSFSLLFMTNINKTTMHTIRIHCLTMITTKENQLMMCPDPTFPRNLFHQFLFNL